MKNKFTWVNRIETTIEDVKVVIDFDNIDRMIIASKHGIIEKKGSYSQFLKALRERGISYKKLGLLKVVER